jgi:hypothetical protein
MIDHQSSSVPKREEKRWEPEERGEGRERREWDTMIALHAQHSRMGSLRIIQFSEN